MLGSARSVAKDERFELCVVCGRVKVRRVVRSDGGGGGVVVARWWEQWLVVRGRGVRGQGDIDAWLGPVCG